MIAVTKPIIVRDLITCKNKVRDLRKEYISTPKPITRDIIPTYVELKW